MNENRLDGVLARNRKHVLVDLALAAFFLMIMLLSGLAFGSELPKLSPAPNPAAGELARPGASSVQPGAVAIADAANGSRRPVDR